MRFKLKKRIILFKVPPYKRRLILSIILVWVIIFSTLASCWMIDCRIRPSLRELARIRAKQIAVETINNIIKEQIVPDLEYGELIEMGLTEEGRVAYLRPNIGAINRISTIAALRIQQSLKELPRETVTIPLGQIFGLKTLASYGPPLPITVIPVGVIESSVKDQFDSVGINQVRHKILLSVKTTIKMVVPLVREEIVVQTEAPLTEAIIMGEVPNWYLGMGVLSPHAKIRK